jgi:hypothetical protein
MSQKTADFTVTVCLQWDRKWTLCVHNFANENKWRILISFSLVKYNVHYLQPPRGRRVTKLSACWLSYWTRLHPPQPHGNKALNFLILYITHIIFYIIICLFYVIQYIRNTWKILKCGEVEGWRRSVGPIMWEIKKYYLESRSRGISYMK